MNFMKIKPNKNKFFFDQSLAITFVDEYTFNFLKMTSMMLYGLKLKDSLSLFYYGLKKLNLIEDK